MHWHDGTESGLQGVVGPDPAGDPAIAPARGADRRRAGGLVRHDEALDVASLRGPERGRPGLQPPRRATDLLLAQHHGPGRRDGADLGPLRRRPFERKLRTMSRPYWIIAIVLTALAWGLSAWLYPTLPDRIPAHWNLEGKVDGYGHKTWAVFP